MINSSSDVSSWKSLSYEHGQIVSSLLYYVRIVLIVIKILNINYI